MDEDGNFTFKKPEPVEEPKEEEGQVEKDPLAGSDLDQRDLDENMRNFAQGGNSPSTPQENPATTRNKPSLNQGPDKRLTGLPLEAGNQNNDKRTERRVG